MATDQQQAPLEAFLWGRGGKRRTPQQIERDQKIADVLMKQGADYSPVAHPLQGVARVANALAGVVRERRAEQALLRNQQHSGNVLNQLIAAQQPQSQPQPPVATPAMTPPAAPVTPFTPPPAASATPFAPPPVVTAPNPDAALAETPQPAPVAPAVVETPVPQEVQPSITESPLPPQQLPPVVQQQSSAQPAGPGLNLSPTDVGQIKKVLMTEVIAGLPENAYNDQAAGIVDTIMNRVVSGKWGPTVKTVADAPYQFSDINGPVSWRRHGRTSVDQISDAWLASPAGKRASAFVDDYLAKRSANATAAPNVQNDPGSNQFQQRVDGHLNYANPHFSDAVNLGWINKLDGPRLGQGNAIHHHGTAGNNKPVDPTYPVALTGPTTPAQAQTDATPLFLGDSHAAPLAQFGKGKSMGVNGATIAQSVNQLRSAPAGSTVFLSAGTNDAVGNFSEQAIRAQVAQAAQIAKERGINLTWSGPTGPRASALDAILADATKANGVNYRSMVGQNFAMQPDNIHAAVSPQGYGAMWNAINQRQAQLPTQPYKIASLGPAVAPDAMPQVAPAIPQEAVPQAAPQPDMEQIAQLTQAPQSVTDFDYRPPVLARAGAQQPAPAPRSAPVATAPRNDQQSATQRITNILVQGMTDPYVDPAVRNVAGAMLQKQLTPPSYQFTPQPNGMVLRKDPKSGRVDVINPFNNEVVTDPKNVPADTRNVKRGLNPVYGQDLNGKPILLQVGDDGVAVQTQLPNGVTISTGVEKIDAGTNWVLLDKRSGQIVGTLPKDVAGVKREQQIGEQQGKDVANLPGVIRNSDDILKVLDGITGDPDLDRSLGWYSKLPNVPGTYLPRVRGRLEQLQGKQFLQAFESLKGGGAITQIEGEKATAAMSRLRQDLDPKDYRAAVDELRQIVAAARQRAIDQAAGVPRPQQAPQAPQVPPQTAPAPRVRRYNPATGNLE